MYMLLFQHIPPSNKVWHASPPIKPLSCPLGWTEFSRWLCAPLALATVSWSPPNRVLCSSSTSMVLRSDDPGTATLPDSCLMILVKSGHNRHHLVNLVLIFHDYAQRNLLIRDNCCIYTCTCSFYIHSIASFPVFPVHRSGRDLLYIIVNANRR